ncbi:MAG: carbohydrate ABC transporter permease [Trueperaceae bacterium]|nr:carbohydrate ABC transporter permease [Trueperaceae bacterium]
MKLVRHVLARVGFYVLAALFAALFALPLLWLLFAPFSAKANLAVALPDPFTFSNFGKVFANSFAVRALFQNSVIQAVGAMVLVTLLATLAAYALSRAPIRGRDALSYGLVLFSSIVTGTAAMVPLFLLIFQLGLIDTHVGVILVFTGGLLPAAIFIMRDFVDSIPRSYEESALVAGASPWGMFRDIALPIVRPGMMVVGVWTFVNVWGGFLVPFILLRSPSKMPAAVAIYSFYTEGGTPIITLTTAYALLYTLPVLALYLFVNWKYGFRFFGGIKS